MCGICGILGRPGRDLLVPVTAMADAIRHRGPDAGDAWADAEAGIALGHRRLSIIDLDGGHQPMSNEDGRVTIMMPHPERVVRAVQNSWHPDDWIEDMLALQAAGRVAELEAELEAFRTAYPDHPLPPALRGE